MLFKKLLVYLIKKVVGFLKLFFAICFFTKCYYYTFLGFYFMKEELFYDLNNYHYYFVLFIFCSYFYYLFSLIFKFNTLPLFYDTIYLYSVWCEIRNFGLLNFVKKNIKNFKKKLELIIKKYWKFRLEISPLNLKVNYKIYTIFDKYFEKEDEEEKQEEEKRRENFRKKKAEAKNMSLNEYNSMRFKNKKKDENTVSEKKTIYVTKKKKTEEKKKARKKKVFVYTRKDLFARYVRWFAKKQNNSFIKILLNIVMSFFCLLDLIFLTIFCLFVYKLNLTWKPLNIRLAYFKKIRKNVKKKTSKKKH